MIVQGDKVVVRWTGRAHTSGVGNPIGRVPPTDKPVKATAIRIFRIADGKVAERWAEAGWLSVFQQIGAIVTPVLGSSRSEFGDAPPDKFRRPVR